MAKVKVEFLKDFATKKKGDEMEVDSSLASTLFNMKVAKKAVETKKIKHKDVID